MKKKITAVSKKLKNKQSNNPNGYNHLNAYMLPDVDGDQSFKRQIENKVRLKILKNRGVNTIREIHNYLNSEGSKEHYEIEQEILEEVQKEVTLKKLENFRSKVGNDEKTIFNQGDYKLKTKTANNNLLITLDGKKWRPLALIDSPTSIFYKKIVSSGTESQYSIQELYSHVYPKDNKLVSLDEKYKKISNLVSECQKNPLLKGVLKKKRQKKKDLVYLYFN